MDERPERGGGKGKRVFLLLLSLPDQNSSLGTKRGKWKDTESLLESRLETESFYIIIPQFSSTRPVFQREIIATQVCLLQMSSFSWLSKLQMIPGVLRRFLLSSVIKTVVKPAYLCLGDF